jgi:hypothetical protein
MREPKSLPASDAAKAFARSRGVAMGKEVEDLPSVQEGARDLTDPAIQFFASVDSGCVAGCGGGGGCGSIGLQS